MSNKTLYTVNIEYMIPVLASSQKEAERLAKRSLGDCVPDHVYSQTTTKSDFPSDEWDGEPFGSDGRTISEILDSK